MIKLATFLHPKHRMWLTSDELAEVERELVSLFPEPPTTRRSARSTARSILVSTPEMAEEPLTVENDDDDDDDVFCVDKFAKKLGNK